MFLHLLYFSVLSGCIPLFALAEVPQKVNFVGDIPNAMFRNEVLVSPRENTNELLSSFAYTEIERFDKKEDSLIIYLDTGYASAFIRNPDFYQYDNENYRVSAVHIIYTKYPLYKDKWLTNYYDLLAWRLNAIFSIDSMLNDEQISWKRVLQTEGKTDAKARKLWHGIAIYLEPLVNEDPLQLSEEPSVKFEPVFNPGYNLPPENRDHDYFRSRFIPEPIEGREPRRNMDPRKLKCPRWR